MTRKVSRKDRSRTQKSDHTTHAQRQWTTTNGGSSSASRSSRPPRSERRHLRAADLQLERDGGVLLQTSNHLLSRSRPSTSRLLLHPQRQTVSPPHLLQTHLWSWPKKLKRQRQPVTWWRKTAMKTPPPPRPPPPRMKTRRASPLSPATGAADSGTEMRSASRALNPAMRSEQ